MSKRPTRDLGDDMEVLQEIAPEAEAAADRLRRWILIGAGVGLVLVVAAIAILYWEPEVQEERIVQEASAPIAPEIAPADPPRSLFTDITASSGLRFTHVTGADGRKLLPETMGAGLAFIDFDRDGDPDLFLANGRPWDDAGPLPTQAFYRNDGGRFVDITKEVGLDVAAQGMGAAVGDYDGDGWPDLHLTAVGANHLFRNVEGRRFEDVTESAGVGGGNRWSTSATFLDYDRDGNLDLFVANYIKWSPEIDLAQGFQLTGLGRAYGPPVSFEGESCTLYRNQGNGSFRDVTHHAGIEVRNETLGVPLGKSLGVAVCDLDDDGWPDILVANDTVRNFAFRNRADGTFEDVGSEIGLGYDADGRARGAMGISVADYRNDGAMAVAIGNFANEMTALYVSEGGAAPVFYDAATSAGLGAPTRNSLTFGVLFLDYDLDGREDLLAVNGHVEPDINMVQRGQHHAQAPDVFWNAGSARLGRFVQVDAEHVGPDLMRPVVGRAIAAADVDGDGDLDLAVTENGGPTRLFRNDQQGGRSLRLDLRTSDGRRSALGARARVTTPAGVQRRYLGGGTSYLAESEQVLTFGLGSDDHATEVVITWPDGSETQLDRLDAGLHVVAQP